MKPIVFNFNDSCLNRISEAIALKAGYLLGDEVYSAGNTEMELWIEKYTSGYSVSRKLNLLERRFQNDPNILSGIQEMQKLKKASDKVKYKVPGHITAQKKAENSVHDFWAIVVKYMNKEMNGYGFEALRNLEEEALQYDMINISSCETAGSGNTLVSDLMQRLLPNNKEEEEPEIFFLGNEFFDEDYRTCPLYTVHDKDAFDVQNIYLHKCMTLPDFTSISADELKTLRQHLRHDGVLFRESINEWIDMCYFGDEIPERIRFFTNNVLPAASHWQQYINGSETHKLCNAAPVSTEKIEVWAGEIPVHQLWDYYRHYEVIKDCSWNKIEKLKEEAVYRNQRWPVLVLKAPEFMLCQPDKEQETLAEEMKPSKKYFLID